MGVDLALHITEKDNTTYAHSRINLDRQRELWPLIDEIVNECGRELGIAMSMYAGDYYQKQIDDPYGKPLKWVGVKALNKLASKDLSFLTPFNKACIDFVRSLPDNYRVIIYWH